MCVCFRLCDCNLSGASCSVLSSVLSLKTSSLIELNLSNNEVQDEGVMHLSVGLKNPHCKLKILRLEDCTLSEESCSILSSVQSLHSSSLIELNLNDNKLHDSGMKIFSAGLKSPHCKLKILSLDNCSLTEESCSILATVLSLNSSSLIELNLSYNKLQDSGVALLFAGLKDPHCKLEKLKLIGCSISDEGFTDLCSALTSNPSSNLRELYANDNEPGESEVKLLSDLQQNLTCKLILQ